MSQIRKKSRKEFMTGKVRRRGILVSLYQSLVGATEATLTNR